MLLGGLVSFVNFGIHALMTGMIIEATRRTAARTDHLHAFLRMTALLTVTMIGLMCAHVVEIGVWAAFYGCIERSAFRHHAVRIRLRELHRARLRRIRCRPRASA